MSNFVVIVDGIDATQRELLHARLKEKTESWWHQLPDVWVVQGGYESVQALRDDLAPIMGLPASQLLVLALKTTSGGRWAASAKGEFTTWFKDNLSGPVE